MWLDLQDWHVYGVTYQNNMAVSFLQPIQVAEPGWESCMMNDGAFYLDANGKINVREEQEAGTGMKPNPLKCPKNINGSGKSVWSQVGGIFGTISALATVQVAVEAVASREDMAVQARAHGKYQVLQYWTIQVAAAPYVPPTEQDPYDIQPPTEAGNNFNDPNDENPPTVSEWLSSQPLINNNQVVGNDNPAVGFVGALLGLNQQQRNWLLLHLDKAVNIQIYLLTNIPELTEEQKKNWPKSILK